MANMRLVKLKYRPSKGVFVFEYMQEQIERLRGQGKERTVETDSRNISVRIEQLHEVP